MDGRIIRVGILGPDGIALRMHKDFDRAQGLEITAVGSRSLERARRAAQRYGAKHAFGSYEQLAACDEVDLVYIATPHNFHMEQAILCMEHGKHVLCEKPMALNDDQVRRMINCAKSNGVFLMEAMWTRLFPASYKLRELLSGGVIGEPRYMTADFCFYAQPDPESRLFSRDLAGGVLLDVGVYTMAASSMVFGYEPVKVLGTCTKTDTGVDGAASITLQYAGGGIAQQLVGIVAHSAHTEVIMGDKGRIEVPDFWHPTLIRVFDNRGNLTEHTFEPENEGFRHEFMHVRDCILQGLTESPAMPLEETLAISRISTGLRREWGVIYPGEEA